MFVIAFEVENKIFLTYHSICGEVPQGWRVREKVEIAQYSKNFFFAIFEKLSQIATKTRIISILYVIFFHGRTQKIHFK